MNLNNLAGKSDYKVIETELRQQLDQWMIRESDYLPLPSHAHGFMMKEKKKQP